MDREDRKSAIRAAGLPVPPKSACKFCPATQPHELHSHRKEYLRYIIMMEARAKPRLEGCMIADQLQLNYERKHSAWRTKLALATGKRREQLLIAEPRLKKAGAGCAGLWCKETAHRPTMMTDYILSEGLLSATEIRLIQEQPPEKIIESQQTFAEGVDILNWYDFLEMFSPEDALEETGHDCTASAFLAVIINRVAALPFQLLGKTIPFLCAFRAEEATQAGMYKKAFLQCNLSQRPGLYRIFHVDGC